MGETPAKSYLPRMADDDASTAAPGGALLAGLGARARRRAEPRGSIAVAGAGCALAAIGAVVVGVSGGADGDHFDRWPGVAATLLLLVAGILVHHHVRRGALATAATVAIVASLPPLLVFLTFDEGALPGPPWSTEAVLVLSTLGWTAAYLVGAGRGRPAFLASAALGVWATVLQLTEQLFDLPFLVLQALPFGFVTFDDGGASGTGEGWSEYEPSGFGGPSLPSATTIGVLSLLIGVGYLLLSRHLDRRGCPGVGTPVLVAALPALLTGVSFLGSDLGDGGAALAYVALGLCLAAYGASAGRRFTCWLGAVLAGLGIFDLASQAAGTATTLGITLLGFGMGTVVLAHVVGEATGEADELVLTVPGVRRRVPRRSISAPPGD